MPNVQPLYPFLAQADGRLQLGAKPRRANWFDGREVRVAALGRSDSDSRTILLSVSGPSGEYHLPLSGGEAAELMFEIGYALEQAAAKARSN
jgi:hypothetical protein